MADGNNANEMPSVPIPSWAWKIGGVIAGIGFIIYVMFSVADQVQPGFCQHFGVWCAAPKDKTQTAPAVSKVSPVCSQETMNWGEYKECLENRGN